MCTGFFGLRQTGCMEEELKDTGVAAKVTGIIEEDEAEGLPDGFIEDLIKDTDFNIRVLGKTDR